MNKLLWIALAMLAAPLTAGEPVTLYEGTEGNQPKQPQAFVSSDDSLHIVFGVVDRVFYCRYDGNQFGKAREAFRIPNMSLGMRRGPRIAVAGKSIVITAIGGEQGKGRDGDLIAYRSDDEGTTWNGPVLVNDEKSSAREGLHAMTTLNDGTLCCTWLDLRSKKTQLFAAKSADGGKSWNKNVLVAQSPDGSICECCHPSIAADGTSVHVLFRNSLSGNRDMYVASSADNGTTWGAAIKLGSEHWQLNACPMDGGMLSAKNGKVTTVWRRGGVIYSSPMGSALETLVGKGEQPWITTVNSTPHVVWTSAREGDLFLSNMTTAPSVIGKQARDPVIVSSQRDGKWSMVLWEQRVGNDTRIVAYQSLD